VNVTEVSYKGCVYFQLSQGADLDKICVETFQYEGVSKRFRTESIPKSTTTINTR